MSSNLGLLPWIVLGSLIAIASAFQVQLPGRPASSPSLSSLDAYSVENTVVDIRESAPRDIASFGEWAASCGVQFSDGFELSSDESGLDVFAITNQDLPAESPIVYVPNEVIFTGSKAKGELGEYTNGAEQAIDSTDQTAFFLFLKVLKEYELGTQSPWFGWLNALPRYYSNGASMTDFCFGCLPPYAAALALAEKTRFNQFAGALDYVSFVSPETKVNADLTRWAFAVVYTRYFELPSGDLCLAPMADYFNHGGAETDAYITYDDDGNCFAYSNRDVPAGQPLRISYGDPTNPSNLLARYGFLDESSPATFCKYVIDDPSMELRNMGYPNKMLFYNDGGIAQEVWDILLYELLGKVSPDDQKSFYKAHMTVDEATKDKYYDQYLPQAFATLQQHVNYILNEVEELGFGIEAQVAQGEDAYRHPRLPLIMRHNEFVKYTFELVQQSLDNMFS